MGPATIKGYESASGAERRLTIIRHPAVSTNSDGKFVSRLSMQLRDAEGHVLSDVNFAQGSFMNAVKDLFMEEIQAGYRRTVSQLRQKAGAPTQRPSVGAVNAPAQASSIDWRGLMSFGLQVLEVIGSVDVAEEEEKGRGR